MGTAATINVRLPESLKTNGGRVLERSKVSPTQLVRSVYRYMEKNQSIPDCLDIAPGNDGAIVDSRRILLRRITGTIDFGEQVDVKKAHAERVMAKYGDTA